MGHKEILLKTIHHEKTEGVPVSFWRHFPVDDQDPSRLAKSTIAFQEMFDLDFVKVSPPSSFCLKDWGALDEWNAHPEGTRDYLGAVIKNPQDWEDLPVLDPSKGHLGAQLECLKLIKSHLPSDTPIIQTIFSPLSQAKNLAGKNHIINHVRRYPDYLGKGLETISKSTQLFIEECRKIGIDGFFYAVQHASYDIMTEDEFIQFGRSSDAEIYKYFEPFWLNVLHIHGENIMFDLVKDYPFQVFNWHDRETEPSLLAGSKQFSGAICGGLSRINTMVLGEPSDVEKEFMNATLQTGGQGFVLGTGCVLPLTTPMGNIFHAVKLARGI